MTDKLIQIANDIKELELSNLEKLKIIESLMEEMQKVESEFQVEIINDVDDKGKPVYSNDAKRELRLNEMLNESNFYNSSKETLKNVKSDKLRNEIEINFNKNLLKIYLAEVKNG